MNVVHERTRFNAEHPAPATGTKTVEGYSMTKLRSVPETTRMRYSYRPNERKRRCSQKNCFDADEVAKLFPRDRYESESERRSYELLDITTLLKAMSVTLMDEACGMTFETEVDGVGTVRHARFAATRDLKGGP